MSFLFVSLFVVFDGGLFPPVLYLMEVYFPPVSHPGVAASFDSDPAVISPRVLPTLCIKKKKVTFNEKCSFYLL